MKWVVSSLFLIFLFACGSTPDPDTTLKKDSVVKVPVKTDSLRKGLIYPKVMTVVRKSAYDDFYVRIGDSLYYCNYKGIFQSSDTIGNRNAQLFDLKAEYLIDIVYFMPISADQFFLCWQETDHKGVYSYFAVYQRGNNTPVWKRFVKAHSPGQPVIDSADVYISSLGMIGKLDLYSGSVIWQHDSLFEPLALRYKEFARPILYENTACFFDIPIKGKKSKRDTIWVNENNGKIVR